MKQASVTEAKNTFSALIDGLKNGSPVVIFDRGRPVARLEPAIDDLALGADERLGRLIRQGLVRPRRAGLPETFLESQPPRARGGASALAVLLEERREGR